MTSPIVAVRSIVRCASYCGTGYQYLIDEHDSPQCLQETNAHQGTEAREQIVKLGNSRHPLADNGSRKSIEKYDLNVRHTMQSQKVKRTRASYSLREFAKSPLAAHATNADNIMRHPKKCRIICYAIEWHAP